MKKFICRIFGHKWKYNHPSQPTRAWCERCDRKFKASFNNNYKHISELMFWEEVK